LTKLKETMDLNKFGEQLCGDMIQVVKDDDTTILVLADGLGSGVKANILSTLTSKIISTMIAAHMGIEECVNTIMSTIYHNKNYQQHLRRNNSV